MSKNLLPAAVVIGALRVKYVTIKDLMYFKLALDDAKHKS